MVSPAFPRKVDQGKVKGISTKAKKPATKINAGKKQFANCSGKDPDEINIPHSSSLDMNDYESAQVGLRSTRARASWKEVECNDANVLASSSSKKDYFVNATNLQYWKDVTNEVYGDMNHRRRDSLNMQTTNGVGMYSGEPGSRHPGTKSRLHRSPCHMSKGSLKPSSSSQSGFQPAVGAASTQCWNEMQSNVSPSMVEATHSLSLNRIQSRSLTSPILSNGNGDLQNADFARGTNRDKVRGIVTKAKKPGTKVNAAFIVKRLYKKKQSANWSGMDPDEINIPRSSSLNMNDYESSQVGLQSTRARPSWKEVNDDDTNVLASSRSKNDSFANATNLHYWKDATNEVYGDMNQLGRGSLNKQTTNGIGSLRHSLPTAPTQTRNEMQNNVFPSMAEATTCLSPSETQSRSQISPIQANGNGGISKPKRKRGKTRNHKLAKILEDGARFKVLFSAGVYRPVGEYSTLFTTEIGILVRQIAPLQAETWGEVSNEKKDIVMGRLRDKFIFSSASEVVKSVEDMMETRYNSWRYRIHQKFLSFPTLAAAVSSRPPLGLKQPDWIYLCNLFKTTKFKARSARGKKARKTLKTLHTAGTKAFSKIRFDKRNPETQTQLGYVELYETAHVRSEGSWVNEDCRMYHEGMKKHKAKAELNGTNLTDEQLSVLTFGRRSGYICGLGRGPKPTTTATGKRTRAEIEREAYEAVIRAEVAEKAAAEAQKEKSEMAERLKMIEAQQKELASQFALMHQQMMERSMASAFGLC